MTAQFGAHRALAGATLLSDGRLAHRAASGDERAFAAIYQRYHQSLYGFCLSILSRPEDAQEALQNTMLKALRALRGEQREIKLKPWLYRIAHNESIELLRKRREELELDPDQVTALGGPAETAAQRERLRRLFADLGSLPERQRGALVMRELAGLEFEQIGEALNTSASVARQTVYEARLNLRQLEAGREMTCQAIKEQLSAADGRVTRRRDIQAHLRSCADCRAFGDAIATRRQDLAAIAPLPVAAATGLLHGLIGSQAGGAGGLASAVSAGVGKAAATSVAAKTVATVAVVGAIGVTAADRGGLVDAGLPGGDRDSVERRAAEAARARAAVPTTSAPPRASRGERAAIVGGRRASAREALDSSRALADPVAERADGARSSPDGKQASSGHPAQGPPSDLPPASQHGQQTAAAHKAAGGSPPAQGKRHAPGTNGKGNKGANGDGHQSGKTSKPDRPPGGSSKGGGKSKGSAKPNGGGGGGGGSQRSTEPSAGGGKSKDNGTSPAATAPEPLPVTPPAAGGPKEPKSSP
jgi:RNA polymerase sigma factor (sigma-70 family)